MTSLRKKVSSYFRQLSFHNEPREKRLFINENAFVNKYLTGQIKVKESPPILHGKSPNDLPNFELGKYQTGAQSIIGCATGPGAGLTTVKRVEKHLSISDVDDIEYIDTPEDHQKNNVVEQPTTTSMISMNEMKIKVAGQTYIVSSNLGKLDKLDKLEKKCLSLNSLTNEEQSQSQPQEVKQIGATSSSSSTNTNRTNPPTVNNNNINICSDKNAATSTNTNTNTNNYILSKSKSAGSSLDKNRKKGKIIRLVERPGGPGTVEQHLQGAGATPQTNWNRKTDTIYGISDSLYDTNQVTREKNGNPIADCFGIVAREDSAVLALADGVNWGEKAAIAAKCAVHGSLHYINKTVFDDTSLFGVGLEETHGDGITNTNEIFICLLRAFNAAHSLILENAGMLTTLTVAVVLPLKIQNSRQKYICCVCNLGDTFAYVYSPSTGVREITKASHDIMSNRDMRDALGALGPVDGINPELNNLTLSATTLDEGDIVLVASDGLTDNYDPSVCKFTVNQATYDPPKHKTTNIHPHSTKVSISTSTSKPPNQKLSHQRATNISRLASTNTSSTTKPNKTTKLHKETTKKSQHDEVDFSNPLVAQFLQDNAIKPTSSKPNKENTPLAKSSSTSRCVRTPSEQKYAFLRSKTSIDLKTSLSSAHAHIKRNEDGLPYITPLQKYELTLLLMEDILARGLSGREQPCVTAKTLCENLLRYTVSVTAAKRRSLEDRDLYYDVRQEVQVEVSAREKKSRRKRCLEKIQNLPGKLDHVTVVAYNVGNRVATPPS